MLCITLRIRSMCIIYIRRRLWKAASLTRTLKIPRTSVPRDKDYWRSPWGKILRNPHVKIPGNNCYYKRFRRRFCISYELFYPLVQECKQHHLISSVADSVGTGWTKGLKSTCSSSHFTEGILFRRSMYEKS